MSPATPTVAHDINVVSHRHRGSPHQCRQPPLGWAATWTSSRGGGGDEDADGEQEAVDQLHPAGGGQHRDEGRAPVAAQHVQDRLLGEEDGDEGGGAERALAVTGDERHQGERQEHQRRVEEAGAPIADADGQIIETHSVSAGLDYPGVGPEHAFLKDTGRAQYVGITDDEALAAFHRLARTEGILAALESSHAVAHGIKLAASLPKDQHVLVNLSGRGDKDVNTIARLEGITL